MNLPPLPPEYYIAMAVYTELDGGPVWGQITDGPEDYAGCWDEIVEHFKTDTAPTLATLKVWHFTPDAPPRDVTEDMIDDMSSHWPDDEADEAEWRIQRDHERMESSTYRLF